MISAISIIGIIRSFQESKAFTSDSLVFAAIGDPHYGWTSEQYADEIVDAWMEDENLPALDFAINIGDFTHFGTAEGYRNAMQHSFNNLLLPWMFVFGNHDAADYKTGTGRDIYGDGWGLADKGLHSTPYEAIEVGQKSTGTMGRNYAFLWDNILFLFFGDQGTTMLLTHEQRQWLNYMTDLYPDKTTVTVSHQGFFSELNGIEAYRYYNDLVWWEAFIKQNPQIALHIHGHNHKFNHYQYHGLDVVDVGITNGMGKPWTVYFEVTKNSISAGLYDVIKREWVKPHFFQKELDTGFEKTGIDWYSVSHRLQDGQSTIQDNRILAKSYSLQLMGSNSELIQQNEKFSFFGEREGAVNFYYGSVNTLSWIGYENDNNNGKTDGHVEFHGKDEFATSTKPVLGNQFNLGWYTKWEEGKVPDSTTPIAIPGKSYEIKVKLKAGSFVDDAMDVYAMVLGKNLSNIVMPKTLVMGNLSLTEDYAWYDGTFTVPNDSDAWIIKTIWESKQESATCYMDEWSFTREGAADHSKDFSIEFNGESFSHQGNLQVNERRDFVLDPYLMKSNLVLTSTVKGSHTGFYRIIYHDPIAWSDDMAFEHVSSNPLTSEYTCKLNVISPAITEDHLSLSPFGDQSLSLSIGTKIECKGSYEAWILDSDELTSDLILKINDLEGAP